MNARDIAIRTILGEAMGEGTLGQAAVAHVLRNRARDPRWPSTINEVALQPKQFSAWNSGAGGNHLVSKYGPGSDPYERAGAVYDSVMRGDIADPTGGATHYYSPAGMEALVNEGSQSNVLPRWLTEQNQMRGADPVTIGGHIFTGRASGEAPEAPPEGLMAKIGDWAGSEPVQDFAELYLAPQEAKPLQLAPPPVAAQLPGRKDTLSPYLSFFGGKYG